MSDVFMTLSQIQRLYDRAISRLVEDHADVALSAGQMRLLLTLWEQDRIRVTDLAHRNCLKKTTVSTMLPKLEDLGLVTMDLDPDDRRAKLVVLTERGAAMKEKHDALMDEFHGQLLAGLDEKERDALKAALEVLKGSLREEESGADERCGEVMPPKE